MTIDRMPDSPVLLLIPPLTQLNTPYPSTAYLTGFLRSMGYSVRQADVGIEMVLELFSQKGLSKAFDRIKRMPNLPGEARQMLGLERAYLESIDPVVEFLQGRDPTLAPRICQGVFLPQGPRFASVRAAHAPSTTDHARHLATLYLEDLTDLIHETVAPEFALSRYAEQVGTSAASFEPVKRALDQPLSLTDELMLDAMWRHLNSTDPLVVGLTVPFPGNLYGALRMAKAIKAERPAIKIILGGGYANTELRRLSDPGVFDYIDYITLDDGERPLLCLLEHLAGKRDDAHLRRTFIRAQGRVVFRNGGVEPDFGMGESGIPTYDGLPLHRYLSILDSLNPMHRLWSDGHWNKLTVAHGCYWKQCTFCDVGLDYIGRYEATPSEILMGRIEALIRETGRRGFHFVDEAAPPAALKALALALLERGTTITWWGNVRFEPAFTPDLCRLLAASGCIAVSAGLEAASDRQLVAMKKGITVDQTARVAAAFHEAGILVHAYLMYGLPGETMAETIDSLEHVRQLFAKDLIQSAFWHRFTATAHSPIGLAPEAHGIRIIGPAFGGFAENDLVHDDPAGDPPTWLGDGLKRALFSYKEGEGLTANVREWFDHPVPRPRVKPDWATRALATMPRSVTPTLERRFVWIGGTPVVEAPDRRRHRVILPSRVEDAELWLAAEKASWLADLLKAATPRRESDENSY
ncbi:MAG: B12-binding domain-containing radical SAM protein, partial [Nitrospiraceae bacterium]